MRSKAKSQRVHARRRAYERHGIVLTDTMRKSIIANIKNGHAIYLERQSNRVTVYEVPIVDNKYIKVAYDKLRKEIVTVLP